MVAQENNEVTKFDPSQYLMDLKGKKYLEVKHRIQWFRAEHPDGYIVTQLYSHANNEAVFMATVGIGGGGSATGWGSEESTDFGDYLEKAETKAIGRALAALGYGTQFCDDHDFGAANGRVVDAPVSKPVAKTRSNLKVVPPNAGGQYVCEECGTVLEDTITKKGTPFSAKAKAEISQRDHGQVLCWDCIKAKG